MSSARGRELIERAKAEVILGDGPMGTMLYERGIPLDTCMEHLNLKDPDLVKGVHRGFVVAGAQLIETNTFGANRSRLAAHGLEGRVRAINLAGAKLARSVAGHRVYVAGSVGPLGLKSGDDIPADADAQFREACEALAEGGVDLLMLETFVDLEELKIAYQAARAATNLPIVAQLAITEGGRTPRGVSLIDGCRELAEMGADGVGANCGQGPRAAITALEDLVLAGPLAGDPILTAFPNAGFPELMSGRYLYLTTPEYTADAARRLVDAGVTLVGGCCGMTPSDIAAMKVRVSGRPRVSPATARKRLKQERPEAFDETPASGIRLRPGALDEGGSASLTAAPRAKKKLRKKTFQPDPCPHPERLTRLTAARPGSERPMVICELDPPKGLDPSRGLRAAKKLAAAGIDAITVGDNPLAVTRMSTVVFSHLVQREAQIPVVAHLSCRDRNLIGTQSTLLGAHALGIRAILAVTGDPASLGNQPGAKSVYDMNSFGMIDLIRRLNAGQSPVTDETERTAFSVGVALNPNGRRIRGQLSRLEKKAALGAQFAQTQPCYDTERVRGMYAATRDLGIPIYLGLLPLFSERAARFIHNEIPGIDVPDECFERLRGLSKAAARAEGLTIIREIVRETLDVAHGYYLIPPFNSVKAALEMLEIVREEAQARTPRTRVPRDAAAGETRPLPSERVGGHDASGSAVPE